VAEYCDFGGIPFTRGELHDVLDRYYQTAKDFKADVVLRITADCPVIDIACQTDANCIEYDVVTDADQIYRSRPAIDRQPSCEREIVGHAQCSSTVVASAERQNRQLAAAGSKKPLRRLADGAVTACDNDSLDAVGHRRRCQIDRVPRRIRENHRGRKAQVHQAFLEMRPFVAETPTVGRRVDDDSHGKRLTEQSTNKKWAP
jgi:hypothetical protein